MIACKFRAGKRKRQQTVPGGDTEGLGKVGVGFR